MTSDLVDKIIRSKRKTLGLHITPDAGLIIRAPEKTSIETINKVVNKKLPWILEKQRLARENYRAPVKKEFVTGEGFLYLGELYKLFIVEKANTPLSFDGKEFLLYKKHLSEAYSLFLSWYKQEAFTIINKRLNLYADSAGLKYGDVKITNAEKRLGSCSSKANMTFSWRLIMAPMKVVDYVVVHELVHLKEHNHSKKFWEYIRLMFPDYQDAKSWLKANSHLMTF